MTDLTYHDLEEVGEAWREYDFAGRVYRIEKPVGLWLREGGTTHRVADSAGVLHIVPAPGQFGCVVRVGTSGAEF